MTRELETLRSEVRRWLAENAPAKPRFKLPDSFMEVGTRQQFEYLRDWQRRVYEAGYLGMAWPSEYGGGGRPQTHQDVVTWEMARAGVPFMVNVIGLSWAGPTILKLGTEEQKQRYVRKILTAEEIWCQGFSEPDNGSDLANVQTTADRDGDNYILNGTKIWTSLGTEAKHMILLARTDRTAKSKYDGLTFFLAPVDVPGVEKRPIQKMTGEYGFNETRFDNAKIPASAIIGQEGQGWMVAMTVLTFERGADTGQAGGLPMVPLLVSDVIAMAKDCRRDGKPAVSDPAVEDQLMRFLIEERAFECNLARAKVPELTAERPFAVPLMTKLVMSEMRRRLSQFAVSLQGANAQLYVGDPASYHDGDWQRHYMNAFSATIGGGTSQIMMNVIGERVLGLGKG